MAKFTFDNFYKVLSEIHADIQRKTRAVMENQDLSESGKTRAIEQIKEERARVLGNLRQTFDKDVEQKRGILTRKADPAPSPREVLRRRAMADRELLSTTFSDDVRADILVGAIEDLKSSLTNFLEMQAMAQRSEKWFRSQLELGMKNKDTAKLEQLSKALPLLPDGEVSERLQSQFAPAIEHLREEALTPAEREARQNVAELDKAIELFSYALANVDTRDEYRDPRTQEVEPATVLIAVNPKLGVSPTAAKFARYKGGLDPVEN